MFELKLPVEVEPDATVPKLTESVGALDAPQTIPLPEMVLLPSELTV